MVQFEVLFRQNRANCSLKLTETDMWIKIGSTFRNRSFGWMVTKTFIDD